YCFTINNCYVNSMGTSPRREVFHAPRLPHHQASRSRRHAQFFSAVRALAKVVNIIDVFYSHLYPNFNLRWITCSSVKTRKDDNSTGSHWFKSFIF
ncbi:MAG: hypothetical protein WCP20_24475, partial [Desulfuromonadales bacterium]